ncbi:MAG TPA: YCF48-related protein, partial [Pirellulales bacterium]
MLSDFASRARPAALWLAGCLAWWGQSTAVAANPPAWTADASLRDVAMVDPQTGWAVGDRGVIWHTADGGRTWEIQPSGVACTLNSVQFIDRLHGWVAGGYQRPYSRRSAGVLLRTHDGGQTWQSDLQPLLPALKSIRFFNANEGWALGLATQAFAAGLFVTEDGGRSWAPVIAADTYEWEAADFVNPRFGALAGGRGQMRIVRRRAIEPAEALALGLRHTHGLRLAADSTGWLTGDGGLLLATADSGRHWKLPAAAAPLPEGFEGWAIAARGQQVWIAGSPGSVIWHSADAGHTWTAQPTNSLVPIRALEFVDHEHGWAVGSLGLILSTADGGRTWQRQHAGGTRAAWLGLLGEAGSAPLELITNLSASEGYLGVVDLLTRADLEPISGTSALSGTRASEALLLAGASEVETAGAFPVRQSGLSIPAEQLAAAWDRAGGVQGLARFEAYLVRQIRTWRPDVIVTHAASPRGEDPLGHAINQLVLRAVEQAGDPSRYAELDQRLGLKPWRVQKVFGYLPAGRSGALSLSASQLAPPLGCALADVADRARAVLGAELDAAPAKLSFQLLVDRVPQGAGTHDFFSGIVLPAGGEARRAPLAESQRPDELLRRSNQRFRNLQAILAYLERKNVTHDQMLAEMGQMVADLEP